MVAVRRLPFVPTVVAAVAVAADLVVGMAAAVVAEVEAVGGHNDYVPIARRLMTVDLEVQVDHRQAVRLCVAVHCPNLAARVQDIVHDIAVNRSNLRIIAVWCYNLDMVVNLSQNPDDDVVAASDRAAYNNPVELEQLADNRRLALADHQWVSQQFQLLPIQAV